MQKLRKISQEEFKEYKWTWAKGRWAKEFNPKTGKKEPSTHIFSNGEYSHHAIAEITKYYHWDNPNLYWRVKFFDIEVMELRDRPTKELRTIVFKELQKFCEAYSNLPYRRFYDEWSMYKTYLRYGAMGISMLKNYHSRGKEESAYNFEREWYNLTYQSEFEEAEKAIENLRQKLNKLVENWGDPDDWKVDFDSSMLFVMDKIIDEYNEDN